MLHPLLYQATVIPRLCESIRLLCSRIRAQNGKLFIYLSMFDAMMLWAVPENVQDILQLFPFFVGDHRACKYSQINGIDVVAKLLE